MKSARRTRSRSNDGNSSGVSFAFPLDKGLMAKLAASLQEPLTHREPKTFHGPKAATGSPPVRLTDEQVLVVRKLREWHALSVKAIGELVGLPETQLAPLAEWRNRVHLDPGPRPTNVPCCDLLLKSYNDKISR